MKRIRIAELLEDRRMLTALADLDGDGDLDAYDRSAWYMNVDGHGNFRAYTYSDEPIADVIAVDIDHDGDLDLVTSEPAWYENVPGEAKFQTVHAFAGVDRPGAKITAIDLGHDGVTDIALFAAGNVTVFQNTDGAGAMEQVEQQFHADLADADDWDGDGDIDLLTLSDAVDLWRNQGDGTFTPERLAENHVDELGIESSLVSTQFARLNADQAPDVVINWFEFFDSPYNSCVWHANMDGQVAATASCGVTNYGTNRLIDVDQDGDPDLLSSDLMSGYLFWARNLGDGTFERGGFTSVTFHGFVNHTDLMADLDQDGKWDLVTQRIQNRAPVWVSSADATYEPHVNQVPPAGVLRAGDVNQDFRFDQADLIQVAKAARFDQAADWAAGDWNGAPGGSIHLPPAGDGRFDQSDLDLAFASGIYRRGPYELTDLPRQDQAEPLDTAVGDVDLQIIYDAGTGEVSLRNLGAPLTAFELTSDAGRFLLDSLENWNGPFDVVEANTLFRFDLAGFQELQLGKILANGVSWQSLVQDLKIDGARLGGGGLGRVQLTCIDCVLDVDFYQQRIRDQDYESAWDLNDDAMLDQNDVRVLVEDVLHTSIGDANLDGRFDSSDLVAIFQAGEFEDGTAGNSNWSEGDWNGDGEFDTSDLVWAFQFGVYVDENL
ncbi:MAG: FG-GAP-like repeat-containing protein [Pirellulaceae bacterium]